MKTQKQLINILIPICAILSLVMVALIFVPSVGYETMATHNHYNFSLWNFVIAIFMPDNSNNMVITNYLNSAQSGPSGYAVAITSLLLFIALIVLTAMLIIENVSKENKTFYISLVSLIINLVNIICVAVFCDSITNKKAGTILGTNGYIMWGSILLLIFNFIIFCVLLYLNFFYKGKTK